MNQLWRRLLFLFRRRRLDAELEEELQFHLELKTREYEESGMLPGEARRAARRQFGNTLRVREVSREFWGWRWLDDLAADARVGLRMLARRRTLTITAIGSLALGIGGVITIYTIIHSVLLRPLPYRDSGRLVTVWASLPDSPAAEIPPLSDYVAWRERNSFFDEMAGLLLQVELNLTGDGPPLWLEGQKATANFFSLLGVSPLLGRTFLESDEHKGAAPVVILGYNFWKSRFTGDPRVLGTSVSIDGLAHEVIGVMPQGFGIPDGRTALWTPFDLSPAAVRDSSYHVRVLTRIPSGSSLDIARARITELAIQSAPSDWADRKKLQGGVMPVQEMLVGPARDRLVPLGGAVVFLLLIACANVAGLLMAAGAERFSESALRSALGAGRSRLIRQHLTESTLLSLAGCAAGLVIAWFMTDSLVSLTPAAMPRRAEIRLDQTVVFFAVALSLLAGGIFGLLPALASSRPELTRWMQSAGRRATGGLARQRARKLMVASQFAVALTLCTGAGLMIQSVQRLLAVDVGFNPDRLITFQVRLAEARYATEIADGTRPAGWSRINPRAPASYQEILDALRVIPGIESASATPWLPMNGYFNEARLFTIVGRPAPARGAPRPGGGYNPVDVDFFRTMRVPLIRGRLLNRGDTATSPWAIVINETLAKAWWPNQDPIGQYVSYADWGDPTPRQIVGIVRDIRHGALNAVPRSQIYFPFIQLPPENHTNRVRSRLHMSFVLRTGVEMERLAPMVRQAVSRVDKEVPVFAIQPMSSFLDASARETHFLTLLLGALAVAAVLLSAVGLYGVMSYSVAQRTQEIGIRVALGAEPGAMTRMVLGQAWRVGLAGLAAGIALSLILTRYLKSMLFGIKPTDPVTFTVVCALLVLVVLAAGYLPARRAGSVDPAVALRNE